MISICKTAFAQIRSAPEHASELISQLIQGEWVNVIKFGSDWSEIRTEHGYSGLTRTAQLWTIPDSKIEILKAALLYQNPKTGAVLLDENSQRAFGFPNQSLAGTQILEPFPVWNPIAFRTVTECFLDVPYVWGGKTTNGLDCSGLVQLSMNLCGFSFPRDAWQQAEVGEAIAIQPDGSAFEMGDLLYFQRPGKRIHHVAISLGGDRYLHASEWVQINSFNPAHPDFVLDRKETLVAARKIKEAHLEPLLHAYKSLLNM